jgi:hypothetical protein
MHNTPEVESPKNNNPAEHYNENKAILYLHQNNYCRQYNTPKIVNQVSLASENIKALLKIGITHFHSIKLLIWIFE